MKNQFKHHQGFTLIELLVILTILSMLALGTIPVSISILNRNNIQATNNQLTLFLRTAQQESIAGKNDASWGVNISPTTVTLFEGASFVTRNQALDQSFLIPPNVSVTQTSIVFNKITGNTTTPVSVTLSDSEGKSLVLSINQDGIIDEN